MLTSVLAAILLKVSSTMEVAFKVADQETTRNDYDYNGANITCSVAQYCSMQQELYAASLADDLTLAPRYVIKDGIDDVVYNSTQMNMTLTLTNTADITAWSPGNNLLVTMNIYQNGLL
jgi:hypothetical protein